ncbi:hypothetical protein LTR95_012898 [Oleoguttula sp. CCFEE 5521]
MYQYWPRLRINLSLDGFDPLQYQRQCDVSSMYGVKWLSPQEADTSLVDGIADAAQSTVRVSIVAEYVQVSIVKTECEYDDEQAADSFKRMYHQTNLVPQTITYFLQMTSTYSLQSALEQLPRSGDNHGYVKLSDLSLTTLLLLSVAFQYLTPDPTNDFGTTATSRACFQLALSRIWTLHSQDEEVNLTSKMMVAVQLIIIYGRPFHAMGILRQVGMGLSSTWTRSRLSLGPASFLTKMHLLMESDMLSEIDGQPTADVAQLFFDTSGNVNGSQTQFPLYSAPPEQQAPLFLDQTLWLRLCLNRIFTTIYMINNAYSNPRFVGRPISDITSELEYWYRSLPIELQFPRTLAAYGLLTSSIPSYKVNIATRYYLCHFMLNKGVCYYLLHKEIERLATPPKTPEDQQDLSGVEIWVFECSRTCLHNALLLVACLRSHPQLIGWYQMQMLISCYAVILQCSVHSPQMFDSFEDPDETLTSIEDQLESVREQNTGSRWTIDMLKNVRRNLQASSPHSSMKPTPGSGMGVQTPSTGHPS